MGYLWTKYLKLRFLGLVPLVTRSVEKVALKYYTKQKQNYKKFEVTLFSQWGRRPRCVNIILEVSTLVLHNIVWFANAFYPLTINLK